MGEKVVENWEKLVDDKELVKIQEEQDLIWNKTKEIVTMHQGFTLLMHASKTGDIKLLLAVLERNEEINAKCSLGQTALGYAVSAGHLDCVKLLVENCADVNCRDQNGNTPLILASRYGFDDIVQYLLPVGAIPILENVEINAKCNIGQTALAYAVSAGHVDCVKLLVENWADVNCRDQNGDTPLILACRYGFDNIVQYLLTAGAKPNTKNKKNKTALSLSALNSDLKCFKALLKGKINLNITDTEGKTLLMKAAATGLNEVVDCLVNADANANLQCKEGRTALSYAASNGHLQCVKILNTPITDLNLADNEGQTPLMKAVINTHFSVVDYFLNIIDERYVDRACRKEKTAFFYAAECGFFEIVKEFIVRTNVDIDEPDYTGQTPLMKAVRQNHSEMVEYLLANGARCDVACNEGMLVLHDAAIQGNLENFQNVLLYDKTKVLANINLKNAQGQTPLMLAASRGNTDIVKYLLKSGVYVNARCIKSWTALHYAANNRSGRCITLMYIQTEDGQTPLMIASSRGFKGAATILLRLESKKVNAQSTKVNLSRTKASVNIRDKAGETALHWAVRYNRTTMLPLLVGHGANVNIQNNEGNTTLHCACYKGNLDSVKYLVQAGANIELEDDLNQTAIMTASKWGFKDIVAYLAEAGANVIRRDKYGRDYKDLANTKLNLQLERNLQKTKREATVTKQVNKQMRKQMLKEVSEDFSFMWLEE